MPKPTVVTIILTGEEIVAAAMLDAMEFLERRADAMDAHASQHAIRSGRFPVSGGSRWGLFLPDDHDTSSVREQYGDEPASLLDHALAQAPPQSVVAWKVLMTIPRGQG